jgi:hypothetical protein
MDAKDDWQIDSMAVRVTLNTVVRLLWIAASVDAPEFAMTV